MSTCSNKNVKIPKNAKIIAKYIVHDEVHSPSLSKCSDLKNDFLFAKKYDCAFTMDGYEFDIEDKYIFNDDGKFIEFWNYLSEGPVITNIKELGNDLKSVNGESMTVKWGVDKKVIVTEKETLKIERIFPKYKLIWIEQDRETKKNGRRILIQYK